MSRPGTAPSKFWLHRRRTDDCDSGWQTLEYRNPTTGERSVYRYNPTTREHSPVDPAGASSEQQPSSEAPPKRTIKTTLNNWFSRRSKQKKKRHHRPRWARRPRRVACGAAGPTLPAVVEYDARRDTPYPRIELHSARNHSYLTIEQPRSIRHGSGARALPPHAATDGRVRPSQQEAEDASMDAVRDSVRQFVALRSSGSAINKGRARLLALKVYHESSKFLKTGYYLNAGWNEAPPVSLKPWP